MKSKCKSQAPIGRGSSGPFFQAPSQLSGLPAPPLACACPFRRPLPPLSPSPPAPLLASLGQRDLEFFSREIFIVPEPTVVAAEAATGSVLLRCFSKSGSCPGALSRFWGPRTGLLSQGIPEGRVGRIPWAWAGLCPRARRVCAAAGSGWVARGRSDIVRGLLQR